MGASRDNLDLITGLHRSGWLPFPAAIADIGVQQLWNGSDTDYRRFLDHFGVKASADRNGTLLGRLLIDVGFSYTAFDIIEAPLTRQLDLNVDAVPSNLVGTFDLVLNFGTSEHVMNQYNAFKVMHDLAKPGGMIYALLLQNGYDGHGLVRYTPRFLRLLIAANAYKNVWESLHDEWRFASPVASDAYFRDMCHWIVLQKTSDAPFRPAIDIEDNPALPAQP